MADYSNSHFQIIFYFTATEIVNPIEYHNSDFFTFWLAGHLAVLGQNPYLSTIWIGGHLQFGASWIPNATFIYPLPLTLLFAPFGLLPLYKAFIIWVMLTQFMIISSVLILLKLFPKPKYEPFILPIFAGVVIFRPTIITLINGQLSGFLLLMIVITISLWERGKWWQGTIFLPILALKPNLGIPIILFLSMYLILKRKSYSLIAGGISGLFLLITGLVQNPNWISEFFRAGNINFAQNFGFSPTIWGISSILCNHNLNCSLGIGSIFGIFLLTGCLYILVAKKTDTSPSLAAGLAVTATLLLTPYTWPYDQLLLIIPIITVIMSLAKEGYKYLPLAIIFLIIDIIAIILLGISARTQMEIWNVMIPLFVLVFQGWYQIRVRSYSQVKR